MVCEIAREEGGLSAWKICFRTPSAVYPKFLEIKKIKELKAIWESWTVERQDAFTTKYNDIALLLPIEINEQLLKAIILF